MNKYIISINILYITLKICWNEHDRCQVLPAEIKDLKKCFDIFRRKTVCTEAVVAKAVNNHKYITTHTNDKICE